MKPINRITEADIAAFARDGMTLDAYQHNATKSAFYPGQGTALGLAYAALKLNGEAGELAEHVGKAMRDDALVSPISEDGCEQLRAPSGFIAGHLTPERRALLVKKVGDVLWYVSALCNELGLSLGEVGYGNLCKLCDRANRDKLQGSGDER